MAFGHGRRSGRCAYRRRPFFDTETTGLPRNFNAPINDFGNWPRLVQLAWIVAESKEVTHVKKSHIVKPDGFTIPPNMVHGISHEQAMDEGVELKTILWEFEDDLSSLGDTVVCHNVGFDFPVLACEHMRLGLHSSMLFRPFYCTMKQTTNICRIPSSYNGYKWPTLSELHYFCFKKGFDDAHNALPDVEATANCFFWLKENHEGAFKAPYR